MSFTGICQFYVILLCNSNTCFWHPTFPISKAFFKRWQLVRFFSLNTDDFYPFQWGGSVHTLHPRCHTFSDGRRAVSEHRAGSLCLHPRPWYTCCHQIYASSCCRCHEKVVNKSHYLMKWDWHGTGCSVSVRTHSVKNRNPYVVARLSRGLQSCSGWFLHGCSSQKRPPLCLRSLDMAWVLPSTF